MEIIKELEGVVEYHWIGGDSVYGNSPELRKSLRELGKAYVTDVGEELQVCLEKPHSFLPQSSGRERAKSRARQKPKDDCRKADPTVQFTAFWNVKNALEKLKINNLH